MKSYNLTAAAISIFCIIHLSRSNLSVYNADQIYSQLKIPVDQKLNDVSFSIANFGEFPYGESLISAIKIVPQLYNECKFNLLSDDDTVHDQNFNGKLLLFERGYCHFVQKALIAQKIGAKGIIVMGTQMQSFSIVMNDNGYGYKVKIPAVFILHQKGLLLKQLINNVEKQSKAISEQQKDLKKIKLDVQVELDFSSEKVENKPIFEQQSDVNKSKQLNVQVNQQSQLQKGKEPATLEAEEAAKVLQRKTQISSLKKTKAQQQGKSQSSSLKKEMPDRSNRSIKISLININYHAKP